MEFKTYSMPINERWEYAGRLSKFIDPLFLLSSVTLVIVVITLIVLFIKKNNETKIPTNLYLILLPTILIFCISGAIKFFETTIVTGSNNHMHYITINGKGKVTDIERDIKDKGINQSVRFQADNESYYMKIDSSEAVDIGDEVKVKSEKKIPIIADVNDHYLSNYPNHIEVSIKNDGTWKKVNVKKSNANASLPYH